MTNYISLLILFYNLDELQVCIQYIYFLILSLYIYFIYIPGKWI
jgi:hypothetical protein